MQGETKTSHAIQTVTAWAHACMSFFGREYWPLLVINFVCGFVWQASTKGCSADNIPAVHNYRKGKDHDYAPKSAQWTAGPNTRRYSTRETRVQDGWVSHPSTHLSEWCLFRFGSLKTDLIKNLVENYNRIMTACFLLTDIIGASGDDHLIVDRLS